MPDIQAHTADGVVHSFPDGTPDAVIDKAIKGYLSSKTDPLTQQTQAAAPKTSTKPFFEKAPAQYTTGTGKDKQEVSGVPFPSTNPIEKAGQRLDTLGQREQHAMRSPTPFSNASAVLAPVTAARQIAGSKVGGYLGEKAAPLVGLSPETGAVAGGVTGGIVAGAGPKAVDTIGDLSLEVPNNKIKVKIPWTNIKVSRNVPPTEAELMEQRAQDLTRRGVEQERLDRAAATAKKADAKRTIDPATERTISGPAPARTLRNPPWKTIAPVTGGSGAAATAEAAPARITPPWETRAANRPAATTATAPTTPTEASSTSGKTSYREPTISPSGVRPSMTEQYATYLAKKPIWSPVEEQFARRIWGEDARIRPGEGQSKYRARLLGMVRSGRAAIGMQDVESGPMQPPPEP